MSKIDFWEKKKIVNKITHTMCAVTEILFIQLRTYVQNIPPDIWW